MNLVKFNNVKQALIYSFKVWLTVTALIPLVEAVIMLIYKCIKGTIIMYEVKAAFEVPVEETCFSSPCFIIFFIVVLLLRKVSLNVIIKKVVLSVTAILLLITLTEVIIYKYGEGLLDWSSVLPEVNFFALATLIAIWVYKLEASENQIESIK